MTFELSRRHFLAGLGLGSLAAIAGLSINVRAADAPRAISTQLGWLKSVEFGGIWLADNQGYFARAGIAPTWIGGGPNIPSTTPIVAGGQADIGLDQLLSVVDAITKGSDLVVLATTFKENPAGLLSLPNNPILKPADLVGKRIGMQGSSSVFIDALLKINNLPVKYTPVPVGFDPTPLLEGACDAFVCYVTNQPISLKLKGIDYVTRTYSQLGMPGYSGTYYCTRRYLETHRDLLVNYLEAMLRGWTDYLANVDAAVDLAVNKYGAALGLDSIQQLEQAKAQISLIKPDNTPLLACDPKLIAGSMYNGFRQMGRKNLPPPESIMALELLEEARSRL